MSYRDDDGLLAGFSSRERGMLLFMRHLFEREVLSEWPAGANLDASAAVEIDGATWPVNGGAPLRQVRPLTRADVEQRRKDDPYFDRAFAEMARRRELRLDGWVPTVEEIEALAIELRAADEQAIATEAEFWGYDLYGGGFDS